MKKLMCPKRKTWATLKSREFLQMRLDLFIAYQKKGFLLIIDRSKLAAQVIKLSFFRTSYKKI